MRAPIVLAIDTTDVAQAGAWVNATSESISVMKLGLEFYLAHGVAGVTEVRKHGKELKLFLDLKLHDIPNTVAGAVRSVTHLQPDFLTVHAAGGAARSCRSRRTRLRCRANRRSCPSWICYARIADPGRCRFRKTGRFYK